MSINYVNLTLDLYDGAGDPVETGTVTLAPNATVMDSSDHIVVTQKPITVHLFGNPLPVVQIAATDNGALQPSGWGWLIQPQFPGAPPGEVYELLFSNGSQQYLSDLIPAVEGPVITTYATAAALAAEAARAEAAEAAAQAAAIAASMPALAAATASASATLALNKVTQVTAASNLTMTLPTPVAGALIVVERESASAGTVTVSGNIRGAAGTVVLSLAAESEMFLGTASTWDPVAGHKTLGSLDARYVPLAPLPSGDVTGAKDTAALQAYINAVPAGSEITLNAIAPYYISSGLTISKALSVRGNAVINQVTSNTPGIVVTAGGFTWDGPALNGPQYAAYHSAESAITVTGPSVSSPISFIRVRRSSISSWGKYGVSVQYASDVIVHDCDISSIQLAGVVYFTVTGGQVTGNRVSNVVGSTANGGDCYGITLSEQILGVGSTDPVCQNIVISGNVVTSVAQWTGIDMHAGTNITVANNIVQGCYLGIAVVSQHDTGGTPVTAPHRVKVTGNVVDVGALGIGQAGYGIVVQGAIVTTGSPIDSATGCSVTGNEVHGYGTPFESSVTLGGITALATKGLSVSGNTIERCGPAGICLYHDNYGFALGPNVFTDCWDTQGHAGAVWLPSSPNTGSVTLGSVYAPATVQAQAPIASASVGQNVSSVSTLSLTATFVTTAPSSVFAPAGSVTVPASGGTATLAYTGTTATTLTGVTLSSGSGTILAGFAQQAPADLNLFALFNNSASNSVIYYRGHSEAATEISDTFSAVLIPNLPVIYPHQSGGYTVPVPWGAIWLDIEITAGGAGGGGGGAAALTGGVATQVGGSGGGSGAYIKKGYAITSAMWGGSLSLVVPAGAVGGTGGAASSGATGNAGTAGTAGTTASVAGSGATSTISVAANGGGIGGVSGANSVASVVGGTYAKASNPLATVTAPGQGGIASSGSGGSGSVAMGTSGAGGSGGGPATATNGGGAGSSGAGGAAGAVGTSGASGTASGVSASAGSIPGAGGGGGGGGAPGGAGGGGGNAGPAQITLTWR